MIDYDTILSTTEDKMTLLQWLKKVEAALKDASATTFKVNKKGDATLTFSIVFADGSEIESGEIVLQQGESVVSGEIVNGHLLLTLSNGDVLDTGTLFNGNITINGDLSVMGKLDVDVITSSEDKISAEKPIVEAMSAYALRDKSSLISNSYIGVVKNGNKLTFAISFELNLAAQPSYEILPLASFYIPSSVASKLYANTWNYLSNVVNANAIIAIATPQSNGIETNYYVQKNSDGGGYFVQFNLITTNLALNTNYKVRIEQTYLLSDNLAA